MRRQRAAMRRGPRQVQPWRPCTVWFVSLLVVGCAVVHAEQDTCFGSLVRIQITDSSDLGSSWELFGALAGWSSVPSANTSSAVPLVQAQPIDACSPLPPLHGAAVLVRRGVCSFTSKWAAVAAANGSGMLLFNDAPGCVTMGGNASDVWPNATAPNATQLPPPPAMSIDHGLALQVLDALRQQQQRRRPPPPPPALRDSRGAPGLWVSWQHIQLPAFDASALVLALLAVTTLVVGALWAGHDYAHELQPCRDASHMAGGARGPAGEPDEGVPPLAVTPARAAAFVLCSSALLLVFLFLAQAVLVYLLIGSFVLSGGPALATLLASALAGASPRLARCQASLPWLGPTALPELLAAPLALAAALAWFVWRGAAWSWMLQDVMGVALMTQVLRALRLGSLRVACVLLPLCFAYDCFFVFVQPLLFGGGRSAMVELAEGGGTGEIMPLLLRVPMLGREASQLGGYGLLGYGDIVLPGLLAAWARRVDVAWGRTSPPAGSTRGRKSPWAALATAAGGYFWPIVVAYSGGLVLTYVALVNSWFGGQGQPALLYLVPATLGTAVALAAGRRELAQLWALDQCQCSEAALEQDQARGGLSGARAACAGSGGALVGQDSAQDVCGGRVRQVAGLSGEGVGAAQGEAAQPLLDEERAVRSTATRGAPHR